MFKFVAIFAIFVFISAQGWDHEDQHGHQKYKFDYGVKDGHTHDHKSQWEEGDGHHVKGEYKLDEADGTHRYVTYHDNGHGWEAHVNRAGHAKHPHHGESWANFNMFHHH